MQSPPPIQKLNTRPRALGLLKPYIRIPWNSGIRTRLVRAGLPLLNCLIVTCGGQTGNSNDGSAGIGGSSLNGTGQGGAKFSGGGGQSNSATGGAFSLLDRCNGMFVGKICAGQEIQIDVMADANATAVGYTCDFPMQFRPGDLAILEVAIDCIFQPIVPNNVLDAGAANGFIIDFSRTPTHLLFRGTSCDSLQATGRHSVDIVEGCEQLK